ncbi:MAG: tetratricopeptide repeat protein [Cryobacterium sp.]|nr:tetratricopeptide repeat protein [Oligoflexia bacterium]
MRFLLCAILFTFALPASSVLADYRDLYRDGKDVDALAALQESPDARSLNYSYYYNRGIIHHALNQDALAVAYLSKAAVLDPSAREVEVPLHDATAGLVKWLGANRLDSTSFAWETWGDRLPLDLIFALTALISVLFWVGFFFLITYRDAALKGSVFFLFLASAVGGWSLWCDRHPLMILTQARMVKSGPGESFLDRGPVELGMKLRVVGGMSASISEPGAEPGSKPSAEPGATPSVSPGAPASPVRWWRVRLNDHHDLGFIPESSGLLLTDESNTPES